MQMPVHIVAAGGFVENNQGEILLVKVRRDGDWVFPGGQVEVGENLIDGVIREVKEESGIDVIVSHLVGIFSNTATYEGHSGVKIVPTKVMFDFVCKPVGGELTTSDETSDSCWVSKEEVLDLVSAPALRTRYQAYLDYNGSINYMDYITRPEFELKLKRSV
ncbi:ADP-ribose pyrophosphatase YjhB (NUDIX family) [Scopulibacillus darangshiensis]|uniref:ADP-ribose pyrophosphatase YjhB (NUDIX family) n=1 Tax=Scopulibacillus darangshiensis TaxID=442528 RepID=A0A4R2NJH2_9BACL|nr:NUDIX hydrolase [Scopulibacillus darangshiensis]TCP21482.1 ADP-ribose pyrophosphatase YjhB (NUDIX family) [Scopulibacillus darangshiensis]